eukprot:4510314-Karenia_brevis.AAC.1
MGMESRRGNCDKRRDQTPVKGSTPGVIKTKEAWAPLGPVYLDEMGIVTRRRNCDKRRGS